MLIDLTRYSLKEEIDTTLEGLTIPDFLPDIPTNAKLLYAKIAKLSEKKGYCDYNSDNLGAILKLAHSTISNWLRYLEEKNYIFRQYVFFDDEFSSKALLERRIYPNPTQKNLNIPRNLYISREEYWNNNEPLVKVSGSDTFYYYIHDESIYEYTRIPNSDDFYQSYYEAYIPEFLLKDAHTSDGKDPANLYNFLLEITGKDGYEICSKSDLAEECETKPSKLYNQLKWLQDKKYILIENPFFIMEDELSDELLILDATNPNHTYTPPNFRYQLTPQEMDYYKNHFTGCTIIYLLRY